jgi:hypothetical protein
LPLG